MTPPMGESDTGRRFCRFGLIVTGRTEEVCLPKNELRAVRVGFDATRDGPAIVRALDVMHVLSRPDTCASLRTMVLWVCAAIGQAGRLLDGRLFDVTKAQLPALVHRRP